MKQYSIPQTVHVETVDTVDRTKQQLESRVRHLSEELAYTQRQMRRLASELEQLRTAIASK